MSHLETGPPKKKTRRNISEPTINEDNQPFQFDDADVVLISSDNLRFNVHSFHLMSASPVFRDMITLGSKMDGNKEVPFTDEDFERGKTINLFLRILYDGNLAPIENDNAHIHLKLIRFLKKYECALALILCGTFLGRWLVQKQIDPSCIFLLATELEDIDLATEAISRTNTWQFLTAKDDDKETSDKKKAVSAIAKSSIFDLSGMDYRTFKAYPDDCKYALLRASRQGKNLIDQHNCNWTAISEEFKRILLAIRDPN